MTEVADVLRLLYARLGTVFCPDCGEAIVPEPAGRVAEEVTGHLQAGRAPLIVAAPLPEMASPADAGARLRALLKAGYVRVLCEGETVRLDGRPKRDPRGACSGSSRFISPAQPCS